MVGINHHKPNSGSVVAATGAGIDAGKPHKEPHRGESPVVIADVFASSLETGSTGLAVCPEPSRRHTLRPPKLDARLRTAADWIRDADIVADIGCDHGHFGAVLLTENRCKRLIAADVSAKALAKAQTRLRGMGLSDRTVFAVADGLEALASLPNGVADVVCILGMGGDTLAGILRRGQDRLHGATVILGAQTELPLVREALQAIGYQIADERVAQDDGRLYLLMRAMPQSATAAPYTERELLLGPCLLSALPKEWEPWLARKQRLLTAAVVAMRSATTQRDAQRLAGAQRELLYTQEALHAIHQKYVERPTGEGDV